MRANLEEGGSLPAAVRTVPSATGEESPSAPVAWWKPRKNDGWLALLFGALFLAVAWCVWNYEVDATSTPPEWLVWEGWKREDYDWMFMVASVAAAVGLLVGGIIRRFKWANSRWINLGLKIVLGLLVFTTGLNYFYVRRAAKPHWVHAHDTYHYGLNPKYYDELGYFDFYDCTVAAAERRFMSGRKDIRNLRTYRIGKVKDLRKTGIVEKCEAKFSPERWEEFQHDVKVFGQDLSRLSGFLHDHGYNGTPFNTFISRFLINRADMSYASLARFGLLDVFGLCLMLFIVARAGGWRMGLLVALFVFSNVVDRYTFIGGSFFRYWWLVTLMGGLACLYSDRRGWGGGLLAASAMLNVFPLLFLFGACIPVARTLLVERRLVDAHKRFVIGAVAGTLLCGLASVSFADGLGNYSAFFEDMEVHGRGSPRGNNHIKKPGKKASKKKKKKLARKAARKVRKRVHQKLERRERIPGYGVGLKFAFMYRGEHGTKHKRGKNKGKVMTASRGTKSRELNEIKHVLFGVALVLVGLAGLVSWRLEQEQAAALFGFTVFFCLLGTVAYYFACACALLVLWWRGSERPGPWLMTCLLFVFNIFGLWVWMETEWHPVVLNTVVSWSWLVYLCVAFVVLGRETGIFADVAWLLAGPAPAEAEAAAETDKTAQAGAETASS